MIATAISVYYGGMYGYWWDPTYILIIIGVVLSLLASARVRSTFGRYATVRTMSGITGAQAAERILRAEGINDVSVGHISGNLTDHYNPKTKVLNLSDSVYGSSSIAAVSVAAHECGHAIQHARGYAPLSIRTALVPIANFGSGISWVLIIAGLIFGISQLVPLGIILFSAAVLFQLVTLPVEFNASSRAVSLLPQLGILQETEQRGAKKVLHAAALTYVAAAAAAILQLLRLIILFGGRRSD